LWVAVNGTATQDKGHPGAHGMPSWQRAAPVSAGIQLFKPTYNIRPPVVSHASLLPRRSPAVVAVSDPAPLTLTNA